MVYATHYGNQIETMRLFRLFRKDITHEVSEWVKEGIISPDQGNAILARYGTSLADARPSSFGYYVLTSLAVLFAGFALILLISHNWDEIPRMGRMLGLIGLTLATNLIGIRIFISGREQAGVLWLLFGSVAYGASIMLIAQIYHLGEHFPDGLFFWALGVLVMAIFSQSRQLGMLMLALAILWLFTEVGTGFMPWSFPLFGLAALWLAVQQKRTALLFLTSTAALTYWLSVCVAWFAGEGEKFHFTVDLVPLNIGLGLLLGGVGWAMQRKANHNWQDYGQLLHLWLLRVFLILLLIFSFEATWRNLLSGFSGSNWPVIAFVMLATLGSTAMARPSGIHPALSVLVYGLYFTLLFMLDAIGFSHALIFAITANLMVVFSGIWLIRQGIDTGTTHLFYTGVFLLLILALCRYLDLIGDYVGGSLLFMVGAGVMFGAARYWKLRMDRQVAQHD